MCVMAERPVTVITILIIIIIIIIVVAAIISFNFYWGCAYRLI